MNLNFYILAGFDILPKTSATINGVSLEVVKNQTSHIDNKVMGGFDADNSTVIAIETSKLTNPKDLKGKLVVMDSLTWRIISIQYGDVITNLNLISEDKL